MMSRMLKTGRLTAVCLASVVLLACDYMPPSYHQVVMTPDGLRTSYRTLDDTQWHHYYHDDLSERDCYDQAIGPDGRRRYLSYVHETSDESWAVSLITGQGPEDWPLSGPSTEVPTPDSPLFGADCLPSRITHLRDQLYGIIWLADGAMHSALFDAFLTPGSTLIVNEPFASSDFEPDDFETLSVRNMSMVLFGDTVRVIWSPLKRDRIRMVRGALSDSGIAFETASTFTNHDHESMSDAIVHDGAMYVATTDGEAVRLWTLSTTISWQEAASCDTGGSIKGRFLYADGSGSMRVLVSAFSSDALISVSDCSQTSFPLPVLSGLISYFPGT